MLQLSQLDLSSNNITGTLPSNWSSLQQVSMLLLHLRYIFTQCFSLDAYSWFLSAVVPAFHKACYCYKPKPQCNLLSVYDRNR